MIANWAAWRQDGAGIRDLPGIEPRKERGEVEVNATGSVWITLRASGILSSCAAAVGWVRYTGGAAKGSLEGEKRLAA